MSKSAQYPSTKSQTSRALSIGLNTSTAISPPTKRRLMQFKRLSKAIPSLSQSQDPTSSLDIVSFPLILSEIIHCSSSKTLAILLRCSKHMFQAVAPFLYRQPRLSQRQFEQIMILRQAPVKRGSTSGLLGRSFSPFLKEALSNVRSIHFLNCGPHFALPTIPRGILQNIDTVVIHPVCGPEIEWQFEKALPLPFVLHGQLKTADLVLRISDKATIQPGGYIFWLDFERYKTSNRNITLLVPLTSFSPEASPYFDFYKDQPTLTITTVLLPPIRLKGEGFQTYRRRIYSAGRRIKREVTNRALLDSRYHHMRLVGGEYLGLDPDGLQELVEEFGDAGESMHPISFVSFQDWLSETNPSLIFGEEEEALLRAADEEIVRHLAPVIQSSTVSGALSTVGSRVRAGRR